MKCFDSVCRFVCRKFRSGSQCCLILPLCALSVLLGTCCLYCFLRVLGQLMLIEQINRDWLIASVALGERSPSLAVIDRPSMIRSASEHCRRSKTRLGEAQRRQASPWEQQMGWPLCPSRCVSRSTLSVTVALATHSTPHHTTHPKWLCLHVARLNHLERRTAVCVACCVAVHRQGMERSWATRAIGF